jgi:hypothetical protein
VDHGDPERKQTPKLKKTVDKEVKKQIALTICILLSLLLPIGIFMMVFNLIQMKLGGDNFVVPFVLATIGMIGMLGVMLSFICTITSRSSDQCES